ncbi:MAG: AEC family transporter [Pseudomonadota bacterium]
MSIVATLIDIVAPVFLVVAAGYTSIRSGFLPTSFVDPLVKYAVSIAVPSLLFMAMVRVDLATAVNPLALLGFFGSGTATFLAAMFVSRLVWRRRPGESVAVGFCGIFGNVVMLGIPIGERAFGVGAMGAIFGIIAFHSIYNYFLGFISMELIRRDGSTLFQALRRAFVTTFRNPLMIGLVAGIAVNLSGLALPKVTVDALDMVAASALPVALFSLGGVLTRYRLRDEFAEASMVSVFSLVLHPALAWFLTSQVLALPIEFVRAAVLLAAMPPGINGYIFATLYNRAVGTAASSALLGTLVSIGTISLWLSLLSA